MIGTCGERLEFDFILDESWNQLYLDADNSTHKICGVSDLFGSNSMRLGVRRRPEPIDGLVAVPYLHIKGKIVYGSFDNRTILKYGKKYKCVVLRSNTTVWKIQIFEIYGNSSVLIANCDYGMSISWPYRLSAPFIEVGSAPSKWTIKTEIEILK
jgi:hypothetical protein